MRKLVIVVIFCMAIIDCFSQYDFRPGYVITNSMDTLHGLVDRRGEIRSMRICMFRESESSPIQEFLPGEIHSYRYNEGKFFISKALNTESVNDTVFVEYLLNGISDLYYYKNNSYSAYFIENEDGRMLELMNQEVEIMKDGRVYLKRDMKYLGILRYSFKDYPGLSREIKDARLSHKSLIQLTKKYHEYKCDDEKCIIYEKKIPALKIEFEPTIGYSYSNITFQQKQFKNVDYQGGMNPFFGLGLNILVPRLNEKLSFLMEFLLKNDYYYGTSHVYSSIDENRIIGYGYNHLQSTNLINSFSVRYTYPKGNFKPKFLVGLFLSSSIDGYHKLISERIRNNEVFQQSYTTDLVDKNRIGFLIGGGVEYMLFDKIRSFSRISFTTGEGREYFGIESQSYSLSLSTGITL